ncbi:MAG: hypothetical protein LBE24_10700 [Methylobacillus sp.]|jgi:hypothetical protein|nr:hypothetical protein [Methylobacillus sp.]
MSSNNPSSPGYLCAFDRVKEATNSIGTGNLMLLGAVEKYVTFSSVYPLFDLVPYVCVHDSEDEWEVGLGTLNFLNFYTIARERVIASSNNGSLVDFSAGTKTIFATAPSVILNRGVPTTNEFRLSVSFTAVSTSDVQTSNWLFLLPYTGNTIALHNGVCWQTVSADIASYPPASASIQLNGLTADTNYDVFAYAVPAQIGNSLTVALELAAWQSDVLRATLGIQDGQLVKDGDPTRRYIGTIRTISATETCDTAQRRFVYNAYNRVRRKLMVIEPDATWDYSDDTWRQVNANADNQIEVVTGLDYDVVALMANGRVTSSASGQQAAVGIGIDSDTVNSADLFDTVTVKSDLVLNPHATLLANQLGYAKYVLLEQGAGADVQSWFSDDACGLVGHMMG